jgi:hypothetical protein
MTICSSIFLDKAHSVSAISSESGVMYGIFIVDDDQVIDTQD